MAKGDSKANKTGGHRSSGLKAASYSKAPIATPAPTGLGPAGTKALMLRARKELTPISDPTQFIAD